MNRLTGAILLLVVDAALVGFGLWWMHGPTGFTPNAVGIAAIGLGAVACFLAVMLLAQGLKQRNPRP